MKKQIDFYESYGYYSQPFWQNIYFKFFIYIFLFIVFISSAYFLIKYLKLKKEVKLSAWDWAFLELDKLNIKKCKTKNDFKLFYFDLTKIINVYFFKRYALDVLDKTDKELIVFLDEKKFNSNLLQDLKIVFDNAVFIKFAGEDTLKTQAEKDLKIIESLVQKTISNE